jgi:hypothetical protein
MAAKDIEIAAPVSELREAVIAINIAEMASIIIAQMGYRSGVSRREQRRVI